MEGKDFAKSKRRTTQRHTPRRGGHAGSFRQESSPSRLATNQDRYAEPAAVPSGDSVPRSQGADLGELLSADYSEFRQRGSLIEDTEALPTPSGADTTVLDLSIDMQALAASLSYLPIHSVLNIEACYCTDFAKPLSQAATGLQRHGNDCAAVSTSATEVDHGKPSQLHKHDVSHEPPVDLVRNPAGDVEENAAGTSQLGLISDRNSLDMAGHNEASRETAADNMMQRDAGSASQMSAAVVQRQPCTKAAEPSESSKAGLSSDDDELDAILDPGTHSAAKSRSTVVQQTSKQEQGSLEDWLDSL